MSCFEVSKFCEVCHHPSLWWLDGQTLMTWMQTPSTAAFIKVFFFAGPLIFCTTILAIVVTNLVKVWGLSRTVSGACLFYFVGVSLKGGKITCFGTMFNDVQ